MMRPQSLILAHFNLIAPAILLLMNKAAAIFIISGITKGMTHHPKTVISATEPAPWAYTTINHTVPTV